MKHCCRILAVLFAAALFMGAAPEKGLQKIMVPVMGESHLAFDSNPDYINDHTVFRAQDGTWHMIGITHRKLFGGALPVPWAEEIFAHATADELEGPWRALPPILPVDKKLGETHVWAPYVVYNDGLYYCFYAGGGGHWHSRIDLAVSPDLKTWTRHPANPMFIDFYDARDPMVLKVGGKWVMYYTKTYSEQEHYSTVAYRLSDDLVHWSESDFALVLRNMSENIVNSGHTESPFVFEHNGLYYLMVCTPDQGYKNTRVFVSDDPLHFDESAEIATLVAHCAEFVKNGGNDWLSHAGWFFDGFYLAPVEWKEARLFSPASVMADSGDNRDYLVSAPGAVPVTVPISAGKGLKAGPGKAIEYELPVPPEAGWITLVFDESGETRVKVDGVTVFDDGNAGKSENVLHTVDIDKPELWSDGRVRVVFEDSGPGLFDGPTLTFVKILYR